MLTLHRECGAVVSLTAVRTVVLASRLFEAASRWLGAPPQPQLR